MTIDIDKILKEAQFSEIREWTDYDIGLARALAERVMAEQLDEITTSFIKWYVSEREARFVFASIESRNAFVKVMIGAEKAIRSQQPASEPDTRESREAEIDKERHHGY